MASFSRRRASFSARWTYDVFVSFRGSDVRRNFVDFLYAALLRSRIRVFRDDFQLRANEFPISKAIEESRISLVVFSKDYAHSVWCLMELLEIMRCRKTIGQMLFPVFYDVDPSEVRHQEGSFAEAFHKHEESLLPEQVQRWREALHEAASISGWELRSDFLGVVEKFADTVAAKIANELDAEHLFVAKRLVGINLRLQPVNNLLHMESNDVPLIGICGTSGIGKTTIAKVIYNQLYHTFDGKSFVANISGMSKTSEKLDSLQEQLLYDILGETDVEAISLYSDTAMKRRLRNKRVLVIIDDVDEIGQLNIIAAKRDLLGSGSRIIVTSRNLNLLKENGINGIYMVEKLNFNESLELFSWYAFKRNYPPEAFLEFSEALVPYSEGLPLALVVLGSSLSGKTKAEWKNAVEQLRAIPQISIQKVLKTSFELLSSAEAKDIFLDISCFYVGMRRSHVVDILDGWGFSAERELSLLVERGLVDFSETHKLLVHDLLQEMAVKIKSQELHKNPRTRSRLFDYEDIYDAYSKGIKEKVVGLPKGIRVTAEAFARMSNGREKLERMNPESVKKNFEIAEAFPTVLEKLKCQCPAFRLKSFPEISETMPVMRYLNSQPLELTALPTSLTKIQSLFRCGFLSKSVPVDLYVGNVVHLDMQRSRMTELWSGAKVLPSLKCLNLSYCHNLVGTPDFSGVFNLEELIIRDCGKLFNINPSIGFLEKLRLLVLEDCTNIQTLPASTCKLASLRNLSLSGCSTLENVAEDLGKLEMLSTLLLDNTAISDIPLPVISLKNLEVLSVRGCNELEGVRLLEQYHLLGGKPQRLHLRGLDLDDEQPRQGRYGALSSGTTQALTGHGTDHDEVNFFTNRTQSEIAVSVPEDEARFTKCLKKSSEPIISTLASKPGSSSKGIVEPSAVSELVEVNAHAKDSINHTVAKVLGYLNDAMLGKIGIYGISGIGKTTVLKTLFRHLEKDSMFEKIIWVSVSAKKSNKEIQNEVFKQLSLEPIESESDVNVYGTLVQELQGTKILLLLDDVSKQTDLKSIGIPEPNFQNGSKVVFAARSLDVNRSMAEKEIIVEGISRDEAWELFHKHVGDVVESQHILPFAQSIVELCDRIPLLIIATGRALSGEVDVEAWKQALWEFLMPHNLGINGIQAAVQRLKLSYDRLNTKEAKTCFLYCSLFPENAEIDIAIVVEHLIQEGLVAGNWTDAHRRARDAIDTLVNAFLLHRTDGDICIKMHDLFRDLASKILLEEAGGHFLVRNYTRLSRSSNPKDESGRQQYPQRNVLFTPEGQKLILRSGKDIKDPLSGEEWKNAKMAFLMNNQLCSLPGSPYCPEVRELFLQRNYGLKAIPELFFSRMPSLKILNLSETKIKSLPRSISNLRRLEILILRNCERFAGLPSEVACLRNLEILDLGGTEIFNLPRELAQLTQLRLLELSFYGSIDLEEYAELPKELIPQGTVSSLRRLKMLTVDVFPGDKRWNDNAKFVIHETHRLRELTSLCIYFPSVQLLEDFIRKSPTWKLTGLLEFKFIVGQDAKRTIRKVPVRVEFDYEQQSRRLRFVNGQTIPDAVVQVLSTATAFHLDNHIYVKSLSGFWTSDTKGLKVCIVSECPNIHTIVDGQEVSRTVFQSLEHLSLNYLWNLTTIWNGDVEYNSFANLRFLSVHACPTLKFVVTCSVIQHLPSLEELVVEDCPAIEKILDDNEVTDHGVNVRLKNLVLWYLPKLIEIWKGSWPPLEYISLFDCPNLKKIGAGSNLERTIKEIRAEEDWWSELELEESEMYLQAHLTLICDEDFH